MFIGKHIVFYANILEIHITCKSYTVSVNDKCKEGQDKRSIFSFHRAPNRKTTIERNVWQATENSGITLFINKLFEICLEAFSFAAFVSRERDVSCLIYWCVLHTITIKNIQNKQRKGFLFLFLYFFNADIDWRCWLSLALTWYAKTESY